MEFSHVPVLLNEAIDALAIKPDGTYVDLTLGRAGHSVEIAKRLDSGRLICFDRDAEAIEAAEPKLAVFGDRVTLVKSDFREVARRLVELGIERVDGILMDLGVSSPQIDDEERGFSYMGAAPLDMRMDRQSPLTAWHIVNEWEYGDIKRILYEYGEERYAPQIAAKIVDNRPIDTTDRLVEIIKSAMPAKALREKQHPAKRSFQAIRIAVNDELGALKDALDASERLLLPGGRLVVITFHSLEDRMVKNFLNEKAKGCICPPDFPVCVCGKKPSFKQVFRKALEPSGDEIESNPRSRSAKLRVGEKI